MAKKKTKAKTKKTTRPSKKATRALVKEVVTTMAEKKVISYTTNPSDIVPATNATQFGLNLQLLSQYGSTDIFDINQGTGQADRIGNKIKIHSAKFRSIIWPKPVTASVNTSPKPQDVRILIFKQKAGDKSFSATLSTVQNALFQSNNASVGPDGTLSDIYRAVNKDIFTVYYDRKYKVGSQIYQYPTTASTSSTPYPTMSNAINFGFSNNDYKLNQVIDIDLMKRGMPTTWTFNDTGDVNMIGSSPLYLLVLTANCDGTAPADTTNAEALEQMLQIVIEFVDF